MFLSESRKFHLDSLFHRRTPPRNELGLSQAGTPAYEIKAAPHIIWPMRFILPHQKHLQPAWMIRTGLFMYDHLGGRQTLAGSHGIKFADHPAGAPLKSEFTKGFVYSDAWVQDARLVVLNCMDAARRGACIMTRTRAEAAVRGAEGWTITLRTAEGKTTQVAARGLVNAAGLWAVRFLEEIASLITENQRLRAISKIKSGRRPLEKNGPLDTYDG